MQPYQLPAGQAASSTPQGSQWLVLLFVAGTFGFLLWGLQETDQDRAAYRKYIAQKRLAHKR